MLSDHDFDDDSHSESGSDFDEDEDPDKIEVPGGGRDLLTAVTYAKKKVNNNKSNISSATTINNNTNNNNYNINRNNINNNSLLISNQKSIAGSGIFQINNNKPPLLNKNINMSKRLPITVATPAATATSLSSSSSSTASSTANAMEGGVSSTSIQSLLSSTPSSSTSLLAAGSSSGIGQFTSSQIMSMAAIAAAGARPLIPVNTATTRVPSSNNNNNNNNNNINHYNNNNKMNNYNAGGLLGAKTADGGIFNTNSNLNMAASLLAQMGMNFGFDAAPSTAPVSTPKMNAAILNKIQALIAANPSFLTSGIPNSLIKQIYAATLNPNKAPMNQIQMNNAAGTQPTEEEDDFEELGVAETYAEYWPAKLKLGKKHPDSVVETASLSSVEPCEIFYKLSIPMEIIHSGQLSALQLESITYASQAHCHMLPDGSRAGFLIGDGAGVGKGRTIAGIIYENYLKGRKRALWISVSNDLKYDAERDLMDIGASNITVHALNKFKYDKINSDVNNNVKRGVVFSTYSALIGESNNKTCKYRSRFKQLIQWCGEDFDGLIIFDECHKAKNLCPVGSGKPTKTGITVLELQNKLPKARVVYASATGASEPKNMAYMVRLGLWGPGTAFPTFNDFINAVEKRGVGAMEVVAMDMKQRGIYIARQLSFHGVTFRIEEVSLSKDFRRMYDKSVELWVEAMQKFTEAAELIDAESRMKKTMWGQFWSSHQRFFKYLCIAAKVKYVVKVATDSLKQGKCVVIGLQSTGEARTLEQLERDDGELTDFVSTAKGVFQSLVEKHFPAPDRSRINRILGLASRSSFVNDIINSRKATNTRNNNNSSNNNNNNNNKRKTTNALKETTSEKRKRKNSWNDSTDSDSNDSDDEEDDDSDNDSSDENGSDTKRDTASESDNMSGPGDMTDSNESDFNPFFCDSDDSDNEPWLARAKKQAKKKFKKKIPEKKSKKSKKRSGSVSSNCTSSTAVTTTTSGIGSSASSTISSFKAYEPMKKKGTISTQDKIQDLLTKKQELKDTVTPIGVNGVKHNYGPPSEAAIERACSMKEELLRKIEELGESLPPNTLDQLIDELGGTENVAEMTGRKGRVVQSSSGTIQYESRSEADAPLETLNITEKQRFMNGEKNVAIISEAASSGISLQSDRRVRNQRRRVHITLELPWSADRAIQQFGRTHRSNQVNAPEYIFLISDLAGERRFASTVAKRLESLGALTHGDRRATESRDLSQFNIDNKYGRNALETVMKTIMGYEAPLVPPPRDYKGDFFKDIAGALVGVGIIVNSETNPGVLSLDKDYNNISKFLNRILGMPVELQNRLFKYFTDTLTAIITQAKRTGRFDLGILDLGTAGENVTRVKLVRFMRKHATGKAPTEMHTVRVERGMIWQEAINKYADVLADYEGFYLSHQLRNNKRTAILAVEIEPPKANLTVKHTKKEVLFQVYRPNTGLQVRHETLSELEKKYKKVSSDEAEPHWTQQYDASVYTCSHAYWNGNCRNVNMGHECEVGLRQRSYYVLAGSVLAVWSRLEQVLAMRNASSKMQVIRLRTTEGDKIVGTLIPKSCYDLLMEELKADAERVEEINS